MGKLWFGAEVDGVIEDEVGFVDEYCFLVAGIVCRGRRKVESVENRGADLFDER